MSEGDTHYGDKNIEKEDSEVAGKAQYGGEFCNPSTQEAGARGLLQIQRLIWNTQRIQGSPGPHGKILSKQTAALGVGPCVVYNSGDQNRHHREDAKPFIGIVKKTLFTGSVKEAEVG